MLKCSLSTFVFSHTGDARRNAPASGPACERTRALVASSNDGKTNYALLMHLSGYLPCCFLHPSKLIFTAFFLQRRDIYDIFASRQGTFCSLTSSFLFRRNDISGGPCRAGASIGVSPPRRAHSKKLFHTCSFFNSLYVLVFFCLNV